MVLPHTTEQGASQIAEQVRRAIREAALLHESPAGQVLTVSLGYATAVPVRGQSVLSLVEAADRALYRAKRLGRDRVEAAASLVSRLDDAGGGEVAPA